MRRWHEPGRTDGPTAPITDPQNSKHLWVRIPARKSAGLRALPTLSRCASARDTSVSGDWARLGSEPTGKHAPGALVAGPAEEIIS